MRRAISFLTIAFVLVTAGTVTQVHAQNVGQSELVVALSTFIEDNFDPTLVGGSTAPQLLPQIYDYLTMLDPTNRIVPGVATSWKVTPDGKQWTFTLRTDVKFSNGDPLTAEDVVFTFNRLRDPKSFRSRYANFVKGNVISVTAPDPATIVIQLKEPAPDMPRIVGPTYGGVEITPKKYFESVGADVFAQKPVGSGPYKLVSHEPGVKIVYEAQKSHPFRKVPGFSRLVFLNIPEESTRVAMLQRGDAHMTQISPDRAPEISGDLEIREIPAAYQVGIAFWMPWADPKAPLANPKVRMALAHAVDDDAILKGLYGGRGVPSPGWGLFAASYFTDPKHPSMQPFKYDPNLARELLKQAGYEKRLEVKLYTVTNDGIAPELPKLGTIVADYWTRIGVTVDLVGIGMTEFRAMYRGAAAAKNVGNTASTFRLPAILDVDFLCAYKQGYWRKDGTSPLVNNPEVERLCSEAMSAVDDAVRAEKFKQLYDVLRKEVGGGFAIANTPALWAVNKKVVGSWQPISSYGIGLGAIFETIKPASK